MTIDMNTANYYWSLNDVCVKNSKIETRLLYKLVIFSSRNYRLRKVSSYDGSSALAKSFEILRRETTVNIFAFQFK